ncbi:uncharacterized protein LOC119729796 [Patiria miniata]|uniref:Orexin-A n=1 Tax=Patiria miniata TaxID=46514 RepID=A0A914A4I4_PATMI|nr:uncharacterized protein LOC119729796 [Patiria miniata]XP_038058469.1 uncharacterized protein LOC119729796 [Patiria miniata]
MAVVPGKTSRGLVWLLLFLVVTAVCLQPCHANRKCSVKGCMIHFGKRIAPLLEEDAEPATDYLTSKEYQQQRQRNLNMLRLVERLLSGGMTSRNSPLDNETE